jgi:hypothetical protein
LTVKDGVSGSDHWKEDLIFYRMSWFHDVTLFYEVNTASFSPKSAYVAWFSPDEQKKIVSKCKQILLLVDYFYESRHVNAVYLKDELKQMGMEELSSPIFDKNLINNDDFSPLASRSYKNTVFCNPIKPLKFIELTVPGFMQSKVIFEK